MWRERQQTAPGSQKFRLQGPKGEALRVPRGPYAARTESAWSISCEIPCGVPEFTGEWRDRGFTEQVPAPCGEELRDCNLNLHFTLRVCVCSVMCCSVHSMGINNILAVSWEISQCSTPTFQNI